MSDKTMVSAKMGNRTVERLEEYAEEEGISRSQATERMAKQGLDVEESDMRLIPVKTDGGTRIENTLNQARQTLENQSEKIEDQQIAQKYLSLSLSLAIFWLGVHIIFVVPSLVSIGTGTVLMAGLIYSYYRYLWE
jgi:Flp pilus assembly protein TadB